MRGLDCAASTRVAGEDPNERHRRQGAKRMIHETGQDAVRLAQIAGQEEFDDLSTAVVQLLVAAGPAGKDQGQRAGLLPFVEDVAASTHGRLSA